MTSIYAELLSNIRQVSARASLPSPIDASTRAAITNEGRRLQVQHRGETASLDLPVRVLVRSHVLPLPDAPSPSADLVWRLAVPASEIDATRFSAEDQAVPWSSRDVVAGSEIGCRACGGCIVPRGRVREWKDLPSENWAEMMEFWHCHKPLNHDETRGTEGDGGEQGLAKRGYGANSAITAQTGIGFVDLTSFMVSERDCQNLLFSSIDRQHCPAPASECSEDALGGMKAESIKPLAISCKLCGGELGLYSVLSSSVNVFKWQVTCEAVVPRTRPPTSSECLVATVIATISRSGSSRSMLVPHEAATLGADETQSRPSQRKLLHLWVLNSNVVYTSTRTEGRRTAIKVLYREVDWEAGMELVDSMTSTVQEVNFPESAMGTARRLLEKSNMMLPAAERTFQQWNVALLERWA